MPFNPSGMNLWLKNDIEIYIFGGQYYLKTFPGIVVNQFQQSKGKFSHWSTTFIFIGQMQINQCPKMEFDEMKAISFKLI